MPRSSRPDLVEAGAGRPAADGGPVKISVAASLVALHPQTVRLYEARGLISPARSPRGTRLYDEHDIARLRRIQALSRLGVNLAGIRIILDAEVSGRPRHATSRLRD